MTEIEKFMRDLAMNTMERSKSEEIPKRKNVEDKKHTKVIELNMSDINNMFEELMEDFLESIKETKPVVKVKVKNQENTDKDKKDKKNDLFKEYNFNLYEELLYNKELKGKLSLELLNKPILKMLIVDEKIELEKIAELFEVPLQVIEYAIITHNIKVPKKVDILNTKLVHAYGLNDAKLSDFLKLRIKSLSMVQDENIKSLIIKNFIKELSEIGNKLNMKENKNQLMLIKNDNDKIYVHIYDLDIEEFLNTYDLSKIQWTV